MSYRPITDVWLLGRPKVKYYGAYPNGFLERARPFMPVTRLEPVLHVCGGSAKLYPTWSRLCPNDVTCDVNPMLDPDLLHNVMDGIPHPARFESEAVRPYVMGQYVGESGWRGILIDPPYTDEDSTHYVLGVDGPKNLPKPNALISDSMDVLRVGGRVGLLHYVLPQPPRVGVKFIAAAGVVVGFNNRIRVFSVFEKL